MKNLGLAQDISFLNSFDEGIVVVDPRGTIVFFNAAAEQIFGYDAEAILGQSVDVLIPESARAGHHAHVEEFRTSEATSRMMNERGGVVGLRRNGEVFDAEISISKTVFAGETMLTAVLRDVSERKEAERRLAAAEQRHRAMLATCNDGILVAEADSGLIVEANDRAAEMFGCRVEDLIGMHQSELHPPAERDGYTRIFREHLEAGRILVPNAAIQRRDGRVLPVEITARPMVIDGKQMMVGFFRDITHRKRHERLLIEARQEAEEASAAKSEFLASVSHELRTPLNGIIGLSDLIQSEVYGEIGNDRYREYLGDIKRAGEHLLAMINEVLDLSRIEAGRFELNEEDIDVADIADECTRNIRNLITEAGIHVETDLRAMPELRADRRAVYQMLLNLISNAVKYTPADGRIAIDGGPTPDGGAIITVTDEGPGIEPERLAEITTPFNANGDLFIRNQPNVGLGLAITKELIERHGGRLEIASEPGEGTRISLVFPASRNLSEPARVSNLV